MLIKFLKLLFTLCIVWPFIWLWLGLRVKHRERLPQQGPIIIVANHNSHIDVFALLSLFSLKTQQNIHPVAAADYFLRHKWLAWLTLNILNIIPLQRKSADGDPLAHCQQALAENKILILFPEGTRGKAGKLAPLKTGIWHLSKRLPEVPIIPVWLKGTGHIMGKGNLIPLPLFIDVIIGQPLEFQADKTLFMENLLQQLLDLRDQS